MIEIGLTSLAWSQIGLFFNYSMGESNKGQILLF